MFEWRSPGGETAAGADLSSVSLQNVALLPGWRGFAIRAFCTVTIHASKDMAFDKPDCHSHDVRMAIPGGRLQTEKALLFASLIKDFVFYSSFDIRGFQRTIKNKALVVLQPQGAFSVWVEDGTLSLSYLSGNVNFILCLFCLCVDS